MATFKTVLHHYSFPSKQHPGYKAMVKTIEANAEGRGNWMNCWGKAHDTSKDNTSEAVEVETAHLFDNQWNTADGRRVFDWHEEYAPLAKYVRGHWTEITPEMAEARKLTHKCGYCGAQYGPHHLPIPADMFCTACLDSPYLKPQYLCLLRLTPVSEGFRDRAALSEAEGAAMVPRYVERQTTGANSRAKAVRDAQRTGALDKFADATESATVERDGMLWLWDRGMNLANVIYYSHSNTFSFGWRSPVSDEVRNRILEIISEFEWTYEIKCEDGKTLTNAVS